MSSVDSTKATATSGTPEGFHRLAPRSSVRTGFFMAFFMALTWTAVTGFIIYKMVWEDSESSAIWVPLIFTFVDLILIYWATKSFLRWTMTGQTTVDVNTASALPGQPVELIVCQPGKFQIDTCAIDFICEEAATYTAGTDTETRREIVRTVPICELTGVAARNGQMLTRQAVLVPSDAMLSFDAPNNKITWMFRVKMTIPHRPDSEQLFPIRVLSQQILIAEGYKHG